MRVRAERQVQSVCSGPEEELDSPRAGCAVVVPVPSAFWRPVGSLFHVGSDMWACSGPVTWVRTPLGVYLRLARVALPFYSFLLSLIVSALMLQSLACPLGHSLTFCIKTFQLKIVAPSINSLPLWMCFSSVRIPVEKMKNVFFFFWCSVWSRESYLSAISVIPFCHRGHLYAAFNAGFGCQSLLWKGGFRKCWKSPVCHDCWTEVQWTIKTNCWTLLGLFLWPIVVC